MDKVQTNHLSAQAVLTRIQFRSMRRRATRLNLTILLVAILPMIATALLPDLINWKRVFPELQENWGELPYLVGLGWLFSCIIYANRSWKRVGLFCPACRKDFRQEAQLEVVMATCRCGNCGSKVLSDEP